MNKLLVFTAHWCKPCRRLKANINELEAAFLDQIKINDIDENREVAIQYNIEVVPTLILLDEAGSEVHRTLGIKTVKELEQLIRNV